MCGPEADGRETGVDIDEGIVVVGDFELAGVFRSVTVGVADKGAFPVVVEFVPGDGDEVAGVRDVKETCEQLVSIVIAPERG